MNLFNIWMSLSLTRRIVSLMSVIATIAALYFLVNQTMKPELDLLYSGLDPAAAGEVIAELESKGVAYDVKGSSIYADRTRRDSLRLELARDGLPRQSVVGYELFDTMNSFTMTTDMFNTAYWRAKEGELARTLLAMPNIRSARVHLGTRKTSGFSSGTTAQSASVTISSSSTLSAQQAKAIQYLTALAVSGLRPDDVAVIDTNQGLVAGPGLGNDVLDGTGGDIEQAALLKQNLLTLLEARVGPGNARVNVTLDVERKRVTTAERRFDPDSRVVRSQTTSDMSDNSNGANASVTVASNLPEGDAGSGSSNSERSETSETITYEISEIVENTEIMPGQVKRMAIAVLINDIITRNADGTVTRTPRTQDELDALESLVVAAAGLDVARGDNLELQSLAFELPPQETLISEPSMISQFLERYLWSAIQAFVLALVTLILGLFVVKPLLTQRTNEPTADGLQPMTLGGSSAGGAIDGGDIDAVSDTVAGIGGASPGQMRLENGQLASLDPIEHLKAVAAEQATDAADLLSSWLEQDAKRTGT